MISRRHFLYMVNKPGTDDPLSLPQFFFHLKGCFVDCEGNYLPVTCLKGTEGERKYTSTHSQYQHQMGVGGQHHALAALLLGYYPATHCRGVWLGYKTNLNRCGEEKISGNSVFPCNVGNLFSVTSSSMVVYRSAALQVLSDSRDVKH